MGGEALRRPFEAPHSPLAVDIHIGRPLDRNKLRPLRRAAFNLSICNLQSSSGRSKARSGIGIPSHNGGWKQAFFFDPSTCDLKSSISNQKSPYNRRRQCFSSFRPALMGSNLYAVENLSVLSRDLRPSEHFAILEGLLGNL